MSNRKTKVPEPYKVTQPNPGAKDLNNLSDWIRRDMTYKQSLPQPDLTTGSGSGINNG